MSSNRAAVPLTQPIEVFFSYCHADEALRDKLEKHLSNLKNTGIITDWYDRKISPGREWAKEIEHHLNTADIILFLISADFLASYYCYKVEMQRAIQRHDAGQARVIPVMLRAVECEGAPFSHIQGVPKNFIPVTSWPNEDAAFADVAKGIRTAAEELRASGKSAGPLAVVPANSPSLPPIWNLTHRRNPNFTGREDLLRSLHEALASGKPAALTQAMVGLGGIGKTQTAIEYAYRHQSEYNLVWWIRSEEPATLASDYAALAEPLQLPERGAQDQTSITKAVTRALAQRSGWLLIFDNAETPEQIDPYLPGGAGHVIVTSRDPAFASIAQALKVEKLPADDAVDLILKRAGRLQDATAADRKAAAELAQELGYLPLALNQAGAYVNATASGFDSYLKLCRTQQKERLKDGRNLKRDERTIDGTWELSIKRVEAESPAAAQLMNLCAFLAPDDIPRDILQAGKEFLSEPLSHAVADESRWNDVMQALRRYSFIERSRDLISVHRLVQAVVRARLDEAAEKEWATAAVKTVSRSFPFDSDDVRTWSDCARLLRHAQASTDQSERLQVALDVGGRLLNQVGGYLRGRAEFSAARLAHERALKIGEATYGPDHPDVAIALNNLGLVLQDLGDLPAARAHFERALKIAEAAYGLNHPQVATYANNLGRVLMDLGDLPRARAHFERALKIDEAAYGLDHCEIATDVNNLGSVLLGLGDLPGARDHYERALKMDEAAYGADHPSVARDANNLGLVLKQLSDLVGARANYERALKILEHFLGPDHPNTQIARRNLKALDDQEINPETKI